MTVFFKVISKIGVSRLFKELSGQHSRASKFITFSCRDSKKNWRYSSGTVLQNKLSFEKKPKHDKKIDF